MLKGSLDRNRVPVKRGHKRRQGRYSMLELDEGKPARPVLRRGDGRNAVSLAGSPQDVVAGLKHDRVNHLTRAEPYGKTSPWQPLSAMPASHARNCWSETRVGARAMFCIATALQVNLTYPGGRLGSRRARMGQP